MHFTFLLKAVIITVVYYPKNHLEHTHYTLMLLLCQNYHNYEMNLCTYGNDLLLWKLSMPK